MSDPDFALTRCASLAAQSLAAAHPRRAADAAIYLAHVEGAAPLRRIADASGRPLSSVHRAVRRIEALRDDPLLDIAFDSLGDHARAALCGARQDGRHTEISVTALEPVSAAAPSAPVAISAAARRVLERLTEAEAFLMVAKGAERAGVFCARNRFRRPALLLPVSEAADLAARDWLRCASRTEISAKYVLSAAGRAWLRRAAAGPEDAPFRAQHQVEGRRAIPTGAGDVETLRVNLGESPLGWLARRRGPDGSPFLADAEVEAGERLRQDFEAAQMGPRVTQDWRGFLTPRDGGGRPGAPAEGPTAARERVARALTELGPGLADAALRACCFLEGLEATERRMGWSARSGKVVLKIALQRLAAHYGLGEGADRAA